MHLCVYKSFSSFAFFIKLFLGRDDDGYILHKLQNENFYLYGRKCILGGKDESDSEMSVIGKLGMIPHIHRFGVGVGLGLRDG